jgi:hypothetical protein
MSDVIDNTYWNSKGKYQKESEKLYEIYIKPMTLGLTDNERTNAALKRLVCGGRKYYRYYNDGDYPAGMGVRRWSGWDRYVMHSPDRVAALENTMDELILKVWEATKHATLPITHEVASKDITCRKKSPQQSSFPRYHVKKTQPVLKSL